MTMSSAPARSRFTAVATSSGRASGPSPLIARALSGMPGLESTIILRWSWSLRAGVARRIFRNMSADASGPMPPRMPTVFFATAPVPPSPRRRGGRATGAAAAAG
ncbi:MAG: hypothetical protein K6T75_04770 [Acetobacteraceae bacterium]|nr:hypothetical protein [Acetobacteraceae bacterium]